MQKPFVCTKAELVVAALALVFAACDVTYVIAPDPDTGVSSNPTPDAGVVNAQDTLVPVNNDVKTQLAAEVPCTEWTKGVRLRTPERALTTLATVLWGKDAAAVPEAVRAYAPALVSGTSGDAYCVALHMLSARRAPEGLRAFYTRWLGLDRIKPKDVATYGTLAFEGAALEASDFAVEATLAGDKRFGRLFAALRRVQFADGVPRLSPTSAQYQSLAGGGLLSEAAVLAAFSDSESWPSARGTRVRNTFLCEQLPPHPAAATAALAPDATIPFREWHENSAKQPQCQGCHKLIDPIGYALDVFDAVGRAHSLDRNGHRFELAGRLVLPGGKEAAIASPADVAKVLASSIDAKTCYLRTWLGTFHEARGLQPLATDDETEFFMKHAVALDNKTGFVMPEAIAHAARLSFELQP